MARKGSPALPEPTVFRNTDQIDHALAKLQRRIKDVESLDVRTAHVSKDGSLDIVESDVRNTIREIFGEGSPEFGEHKHIEIWAGDLIIDMSDEEWIEGRLRGRTMVVNVLKGLMARLKEKREDLEGGDKPKPTAYFNKLNLHPRILEVSEELFVDGHHWEAVFAASKALMNYVKERSGSELDGTKLMYAVFSRTTPILSFNELAGQTDGDVQEGIMHQLARSHPTSSAGKRVGLAFYHHEL